MLLHVFSEGTLGSPVGIWDCVSTRVLPWLLLCDLGMSPSLEAWMRLVPWERAGDQLGLPSVSDSSFTAPGHSLKGLWILPQRYHTLMIILAQWVMTEKEIKNTWMSINRQMGGGSIHTTGSIQA